MLWQHWAGCQHLCSFQLLFFDRLLRRHGTSAGIGDLTFTSPTTLTWRLTLSRPSSSCLGLWLAPGLNWFLALAVCFGYFDIYGFLPLVVFLGSIHWTSSRTPSDAISGDSEQGRDWLGSYTNVVCALLDSQQISALHRRLRRHHSRDHHFLGRLRSEMARLQSESHGWFCGTCRKMRSPQAHYCDLCGQAWQDCIQYPSKNASRRGQTDYYSGYTQEYEETPWAGPAWTRESKKQSEERAPDNRLEGGPNRSHRGKDRARVPAKARRRAILLWPVKHNRLQRRLHLHLLLAPMRPLRHGCPCLNHLRRCRHRSIRQSKGSTK